MFYSKKIQSQIQIKLIVFLMFIMIISTTLYAKTPPQPEFSDSYTYTIFMNCTGRLDNYALLYVTSGIEVMFSDFKKYSGPLRIYLKPGFHAIKAKLDAVKGFTTSTTDYSEHMNYFSPGRKYLLSASLGDKSAFFHINELTETEIKDIQQKFSVLMKKNTLDFKTTKFAVSLERLTYSRNLDCNPRFSAINRKLAFYSGGYNRAIVLITPGENIWKDAIIPQTYPLKSASYFDWMPDGKSLLCIIEKENDRWNIAKLELVLGKLEYTKINEDNKTEAAVIEIEQYQPMVLVDSNEWILKWSRPRISPDGEKIYFDYEQNGKWFIAVKYLSKNSIDTLWEGSRPVISKDGKWLAYIYNNGLYIKSLELCQDLQATTIVTDKNYTCENPDWSPDGKYLVFEAKLKNEWRSEELYAVNIENKKIFPLTQGKSMICYEPNWGVDGYIYFRAKEDKWDISDIWRLKPMLP